jgi:hypothetical protein
MKGRLLLLVGVLMSSISLAQFNTVLKRSINQNSSPLSGRDRLYFSMGGGLGGGTNVQGFRYNYYALLPTIGYRVSPEVLLGVNLQYSKYSFPDLGASYDQLGGALFARYYLQQLFFQLEYDKISSTTFDNASRRYFDRLLVGVGYVVPLGKRGGINAMVLYDLLYQQNGVFQSPIVYRAFFSF